MTTPEDNEHLQQAIKYFGQHLVGICFLYRTAEDDPNDPPYVMVCSGTLISFRGVISLLTAGHIVDEVNAFAAKGWTLVATELIDNFNAQAKHNEQVPISWPDLVKVHLDEDGLDFALVVLHANTVRLLRANNIVAFAEDHWQRQDQVAFENLYWMLGVPAQYVRERTASDRQITLHPVILEMRRSDPPPDRLATIYPRAYFRIENRGDLDSIGGMSGGPIFGFRIEMSADGAQRVRYWITAIQSAQLKYDRDLAVACPVPTFARLVSSALDDHLEDEEAMRPSVD